MCDVAQMYLRIGLVPQDQKYHRFLWKNMDQTKQPGIFESNSLVFGVNSERFEAQFVPQEHALDLKDACPLAADTVLNSTNMDETMESVADKNCDIELYQELSTLRGEANMHARRCFLRKFLQRYVQMKLIYQKSIYRQ